MALGADGYANLDIDLVDGRPPVVHAHAVHDTKAATAWIEENRTAVRAALLRFGHLMIRGLHVVDAHAFAAVRDVLFHQHLEYRERSTPRSELADGVYSSTDMPAMHPIRLHNESSYVLNFPGVLLFGCVDAPDEGGATTVGDSREVLAKLDPGLVGRMREQGWTLLRNYQTGLSLSWNEAYGIEDRDELEAYLQKNLIAWQWQPDGSLRTSQRRSAVVTHPQTGEPSWFNHVAFWNRHTMNPAFREVLISSYGADGLPYDTVYGDGEPFAAAEIEHLNEIYRQVERRESYRVSDLLLVDNVISAHGREPYRGSRRILVAMSEARSVYDCSPSVAPAPGPLPTGAREVR
jgi:hypothetical protein